MWGGERPTPTPGGGGDLGAGSNGDDADGNHGYDAMDGGHCGSRLGNLALGDLFGQGHPFHEPRREVRHAGRDDIMERYYVTVLCNGSM